MIQFMVNLQLDLTDETIRYETPYSAFRWSLFKESYLVPQPLDQYYERRDDPRQSAAFAFWFQPMKDGTRSSAWMLNHSTGGAAFLTTTQEAPTVGERIRLSEMHSPDRLVCEGNPPLPAYARVIRRHDEDGTTRRVAIRFEVDMSAELASVQCSHFAAACGDRHITAIPPPIPTEEQGNLTIPSSPSPSCC